MLWSIADGLSTRTTAQESASLHLDAIKTGLTVSAGLGAGVTLLLALRRQALNERAQQFAEQDALRRQELGERAQRHAEADAEERRITELYVRAVDQIGSDKAPVRLGGLYALDRLGSNNPALRHTIMDVYCAYLRMPPGEPAVDPDFEVRMTVQRLILRRCRPDAPEFWGESDLNLSEALLNGFRAAGCRFGRLNCNGATLSGEAEFDGATFTGAANFDRVEFGERAGFRQAEFGGEASFRDAAFGAASDFEGTRFSGDASFHSARFAGDTKFVGANFVGVAAFPGARMVGHTTFVEARFHAQCDFRRASFDDGTFRKASFAGLADFNISQFEQGARFTDAQFSDAAGFGSATFNGETDFRRVVMEATAYFRSATFGAAVNFDGLQANGHVDFEQSRSRSRQQFPAGWRVSAAPDAEWFTVVKD